MKNFLEYCTEMAINRFELKGDWEDGAKKRSYDSASIKILKNEQAVEKIKNMWSKSNIEFDIYMVRGANVNSADKREVGVVDEDYVKNELKLDLDINDENTTIIYTNNVGDEKVPMTGWILAHRFGHAIRTNAPVEWEFYERTVFKMVRAFYSAYGIQHNRTDTDWFRATDDLRLAFEAVGTMASARKKKLPRPYEFLFELFAQYLISGDMYGGVTLNRDIPDSIKGRQLSVSKEEWDDIAYEHEVAISNALYSVLYHGDGKIFVM
jgi:hypothetical protein